MSAVHRPIDRLTTRIALPKRQMANLLKLFACPFLLSVIIVTTLIQDQDRDDLKESTLSPTGRSDFSLVFDPSVRRELALLPEQLQKVHELEHAFDQELIKRLQNDTDPTARSASRISRHRQDVNAEYLKKIDDILLPVQRERLQQIILQNEITRHGMMGALTADHVAHQLDIDPQQKSRLVERAREIQIQLQKDIQTLKKQAEEELLEELSNDQQKKFEALLGEPFERRPPNYPDD